MKKKNLSGNIIISIDFEMRWGVHDVYGPNMDAYRKNLENSRDAVTETLKMFKDRNLRSTWATVGALAMNDWNEYYSYKPPIPNYKNEKLNFLESYSKLDPNGLLHFAPDLVRKISNTKGQDLGSHSFSHLYFLEDGIKKDDFIKDGELVKSIFQKKFNITPVSFVFPRNQINFLDSFKKLDLITFRSVPNLYSYNYCYSKLINLYSILSPYISGPFDYNSKYSIGNLFIRFNLNNFLWKLQLQKIKNKLIDLKQNQVLHIWWHPHNIGPDLKFGLNRFEQLFDLIYDQVNFNNIRSLNMKDLINE